ncbi:MAG TPA: Zn-ribbon domain-containing OB-fold protein [Burkholderiales bacterium]|nr:Zn-ribbon domain-containing OB-fold protein [Burkholderiales bacterium]
MSEYRKPLPAITDENRPFWEGCKQGRLQLQQCGGCGHIRYPISHVCPDCLSYEFAWKPLSGRGVVFSYVVFHQLYNKAFAEDIPYNVALVQLAEGPRMYSNIVGVDNDAVKIGDPVEVVFDAVTPEVSIPKFRPSAV